MSYTFGQPLAGHFFDRVGSRIGFAVSIGVWSLANMLTATVTAFRGFVGCRLALGLGESGNYPGGVKVVGEQFSPQERSFAGGVFTSGASVGAILAGPLVSNIAGYWGWRAAFLLTGGLGFLWLAGLVVPDQDAPGSSSSRPRGRMFRRPSANSSRREAACAGSTCSVSGRSGPSRSRGSSRSRRSGSGSSGCPSTSRTSRGLSGVQTGWLLTQPFLALDLGYLSGGWDRRAGSCGAAGRYTGRAVMIVAAMMMMSSIPAATSSSVTAFMALISLGPHGPRGLVHQRDDDALGHRPSRDGGHPLRDHRDGRRSSAA